MHILTKEQKLENYKELYESKLKKYHNLKKELLSLKSKIEILESDNSDSRVSNQRDKDKSETEMF